MNKRTFLSLVVFASSTVFAFGQDSELQKFHFGLKASPTINWLRVDEQGWESDGSRIGMSYGLMTEFAITKNYAFATGLEINYRGGKFKGKRFADDVNFVDASITQKLQYVEVPIGLKLKTNEIGYITYYGLFGALPGVLVKASENVDFSDNKWTDLEKNGNQSSFYVFNAHLNVGAGIEYNIGGNTSITAGIHYNNGLLDIYKGPKDQDLSAQIRTDAIVLNFGIFF
jgi:opacity protein-like surface antigen